MSHRTLLLSREDVARCLDMKRVIEIVDQVFKAHGEGQVVMPPKITLDLAPIGIPAWTNAMPAYVGPLNVSGIKWAGGYINNPKLHGLSYVMATIILQDPETGVPLSVMDGVLITNMRTGAAAALSAKYFANPGPIEVGIIGAGTQGRTSLQAISNLFEVTRAKAYDINQDASRKFSQEMSALGFEVIPAGTAEEACVGSDVVITATQANEPLVMNEWLKEGCVAVSLGSYQEFDDRFVLEASKIVVDNWDQCAHRGELARLVDRGILSRESVYAELGEVASGKKAGRGDPKERILVVPIGLGSHDVAVAFEAYSKAKATGLGTYFEFFSEAQ